MSEREHNWEERREQLSALLDDELAAAERADLEAHLSGCAACRAELESLRRARALLGALPQPALPRSFLLPVEPAARPSAGNLGEAPRAGQRPAATPAPAPSAPAAGHAPLPLSTARNNRLRRSVQVVRWLSTSAAVFGLLLLCGSAFTSLFAFRDGAANTASAPAYTYQTTATQDQAGTSLANTPPVESTTKGANPGASATPTFAQPSPGATATRSDTGGNPSPAPTQAGHTVPGSGGGFTLSTPELGLLLLGVGVVGLVAAAILRRVGASTGR